MALHTQGGYGPAERTRARPEPYTLGTFKDTALAAASRLLHSVESWMARAVQPAPNDERSFRPWNRPEGDFGGFGDVPARVEPAGEVAPEPLQPTPLQVEGGPLRLGGEPRTPLFRHPLDAPGPALTARRLEKETSVVQGSLLAPLDEVLAKYVQDRTGGSEGAHVFNLTARERLDFEAKLGRDLARLANTSSSRRIFDTAVTAPKPSLDVWSSAPPRGFSLGGVVAPPALPPVEKTRKANAASRKLITAEESDDVVEVEKPPKKAPGVAEESDDVVEVVETRPKGRAAKSAPKPKKEAAMEKFGQGVEQLKGFQKPEAVEVPEDKEVQKVTSKEDFWRVQIEAIYRRRNPHKLADVSDMLEKHKGKEMVLYKKVCQRYDLNPKKLYADPQAWDSEDKDVKDEDSDGGDKASTAPTGGGLFDSAPAVPSLFLSGSSGSLFGAASSGGDSTSPFSIPVADPDKKINIFGSSTQAEKRFTSALGSTGSGGEGLFAASSGGLFGSGGIFGASSGATEETTPKTKAKPDFPPAPVFGADVEEKTPKSKVKPDFPPAPAFGLEPEKTPTKAKPAFPSGDVPGLFAGEKTPRSKAKPAFPAPAFGVSEEAAVSSLFGSTGTSGNIFGSSAPGEEKKGGANLFGSGNLFAGGTSGDSASGAFFGAGSSGGLFGSAASSGSIFGTGESSFGSQPAETTLGFGGKSSDTKSSETFAFGSNTAETKPSETFGFGSKPAETKPLDLFGAGSKSSDTKSSETFAFGSKTADTKPLDLFGAGKSSDTKSSETFGFGSKPAETKPLDLFGAGSKSSDTKSSETFAFGSNTADTKPLDLFGAGKSSDTKSSETFGFGSNPAETKPLDLFGAGSKSSDTKSSETFAFGSNTADTKPLDLFGAGKSSDAKSSETFGFGSKPAETKPLDLFGAGSKSSDTKSSERFAFGSKTADTKPLDLFGAGKSSDTKSGETFAFGSKTAETKPPETFGFGSKPAESKPVDLFGAGSKSSSAFGFGSTSGSAGFGSTSGANLFGGKEATGDGLFASGEAKAPASEKRSRSPPLGGDTFGRQVSAPLDLVPGAEEPRSKRRAGSLPDEQEEAAAEPGPRSKAHADVLAKRKIVRARRSKKEEAPSATEIQAKPSAEFPPPPPNQPLFTPDPAIASLAPGLPGASSSAGDEPAPSSNPFAGITGKPEPKKPEAKPAAKKAKQEETGEAEGPVKVDTKEDLWRVQIEAIYRKRNPMKLKEVPQLMEKHKGKEVILFKKVCKRYDLDPTKIYTNDDAWAGEDKEFKDDPEEPEAEAAQTGAVSVPSLFGNTGGASLFGSATSSGSLFGSGSGGSIFGNASSATSLFGSSSSAASSGGGSALFGAPTAPASGSLFGSGSGSGGSIFGASSGSIFGAPSSGNLFGSTASQSPEGGNIFAGGGGNLFGSGGNLFGSPSSGGFGAGFGAAAPSSGAGGSIFCGGSSGSSPFGGSESASLFGSGSSSGNMFAFGATGGSGGTNKKKRRAD